MHFHFYMTRPLIFLSAHNILNKKLKVLDYLNILSAHNILISLNIHMLCFRILCIVVSYIIIKKYNHKKYNMIDF